MSIAVRQNAIRLKRLTLGLVTWLALQGGCSTTEVSPVPLSPVKVPEYVTVPHPLGTDEADLRVLFRHKDAPSLDSLKDCGEDYKKLATLTQSEQELRDGALELVKKDPVKYHWCFYGKLLELSLFLRGDTYLDERQKKILETYEVLVPIARGFMAGYRDSRYMRWATAHYRRASEWVFFRKVELSPRATSEMVETFNPFGLWREPDTANSVLNKYGVASQKPESEVSAGPALVQGETPPTAPAQPEPEKLVDAKDKVDPKALPLSGKAEVAVPTQVTQPDQQPQLDNPASPAQPVQPEKMADVTGASGRAATSAPEQGRAPASK